MLFLLLVQDQMIPKACILAVLGVGETWLKEAKEESQLARMFDIYGQQSADEVIKEIEAVWKKPAG